MHKLFRPTCSALLLALLSSPVHAATVSDADIVQMKKEIAALSQQVKALKAESQKAKAQVPAPSSATPSNASPASAPVPPSASESNKSVAEPTAKPTVEASAGEAVTKGSFPGSFHIPGTDTSVKLGGYVKLDAIADIGEGYGASYAKFYNIPLKGSAQTQQSFQSTFGAQQSRLNVETRTATGLGELRTVIEGDFYNTNAPSNANINGYGLQLRHAYGSLGTASTGQLLAGQTWSNFMDVSAMPESMDYIGPVGTVFVRQPQVRYTHNVGPVTVAGSVEAPLGGSGIAGQNAITNVGTTTANTSAQGKMPDITLRGDYKYGTNSYVGLRLLGSQINVDRTVGTNNNTATKYGYGVAISGNNSFENKDAVLYSAVFGEGTGRYVFDINQFGNYYNTTTGHLDTQQYIAGTLGYQHVWSDQFRSNLFGGATRIINDTAYSGLSANKFVASGHANIIWQPAVAYKIGLEYMRGYRKVESGVEGSLNRMEASFIYGF